jgi:hypothetical protein
LGILDKDAKKEPGKATGPSVRVVMANAFMAIETGVKEDNECQVKK